MRWELFPIFLEHERVHFHILALEEAELGEHFLVYLSSSGAQRRKYAYKDETGVA